MNREQMLGLTRHVLAALGVWLISSGYIEDALWNEVVGAVLVIVSAAWSFKAPEKQDPQMRLPR
jgi:hypothetical protein